MTDSQPRITFENYHACPDDGIRSISPQGILLDA